MSVAASDTEVKVLVADDSAFMRTALKRMIESDPSLRVVGTAQTGMEALEKVKSLQPDVVTLDIEMPGLNGLETLKRIMQDSPRPVIMVSSLTQEGAETTLEALDLGAFDYLPKQLSYASLDIVKIKDDLVAKIKAAHRSHLPGRRALASEPTSMTPRASSFRGAIPVIVALGTSTGGPKALQEILPALPKDLPVGVLIVQHMPPGFTGPLARRLNNLCQVTVLEADEGMLVQPGHVYIAAAGKHMTVRRRGSDTLLHLSENPSNSLHIPSVDVMMLSVAETFRSLAMGVIMTGMGADGALGMEAISREGGLTVGQDEPTCAVYGMPRSCAEMGVLRRVVPLMQIPQQIVSAVGYRPTNSPGSLRAQSTAH
jgi:two-component system chemotaxis response regulator CheB